MVADNRYLFGGRERGALGSATSISSTDIKRLIDFMLGGSPATSNIDLGRSGLLGRKSAAYSAAIDDIGS